MQDEKKPTGKHPKEDSESKGKVGRLLRIQPKTIFFGSAVILALLLFAIAYMGSFVSFAKMLSDILSPLIIGGAIAYLCNPIFVFFEYRLFGKMPKGNVRRWISLSLTLVTALAIVFLVIWMMVPELYASIQQLIEKSNQYIASFLGVIQSVIDKFNINLDISDVAKLEEALVYLFGSVENMVQEVVNFVSQGNTFESLMDILGQVFTVFKNIILGIFIAFYILGSKDKRIAQIRKFRAAIFTEKQDKKLGEFIELTDRCFGGFIFGKIIDSLVIGILTFALMSIFEISEYNMLISTFVGITNVIPVFGPFIGAIPSAFIVLISNPSKCFLFIVLILIIQQLDGNIIGPKILGDNTGVSSLCVIIAICTAGALWGVPGMIIGVPIFAVIIEWIKRILESRLKEKNKPTDTLAYYPSDAVSNPEQDLYYEHSILRYQYEHSRLKPRFERMKNKVYRSLGRHNKPSKPANSPSQPHPPADEHDTHGDSH